MVKRIFPALVLGLALLAPACHTPVSVQTPAGQVAYTADQIVLRVNELQTAAIQAQATGGLSEATTRRIVQFAVAADKTLKDTPAGWQVTVATAWKETKAALPAITDPAVAAAMGSVDVVLAAF